MTCPGDCSWSWRKILGLRAWARRKMRFRIGNGENVLLWFDNWHPLGPIVDIMGERVIYDSGLDRMATVATIIEGSSWRWPPARSAALLALAHSMTLDYIPCSTREDELIWEEDCRGIFSVRSAWDTMRIRGTVVRWHQIVWFRKAIPRHSFVLWLAIQGGFCTQDRLMDFGTSGCSRCFLCGCSGEDIDHLLFQCTFSSRVWTTVLAMCGLDWSPRTWSQTIEWMYQYINGSLCQLLVRLSFAASVYYIWRERNARCHDEPPRSCSVLLSDIVFSVRTRASLLRRVKPSYDNKWLHLSWHLSDDIFSVT